MKCISRISLYLFGTIGLVVAQADPIWIAGEGGVYRSELDNASGELSEPALACSFGSGSFLAIHPSLDVIYSSYREKPEFGYVSLVSGDSDDALEIQSKRTFDSATNAPSHLSVSPDGMLLVGAHYSRQANVLFELDEDGAISESFLRMTQSGSGPHPRQAASHPHWTGFSADGTVFSVVDLGTDEVWSYDVGRDPLSATLRRSVKLPSGSGPRHMAVNSRGGYAYVNGELDLALTAFRYDGKTHEMSPIQHLPMVPEGTDVSGATSSEIQLDATGRFLFCAIRGLDLIVVCEIDAQTGMLSLVERQASGVERPRNFTVSRSGKWLIAAGQDSNDLVVFSIDPQSGALDPTESRVMVPSPVCVRAWGRM